MKPASPAPARPLRRMAQIGFWFFLIKGLLWLLVPAALYALGRVSHWF